MLARARVPFPRRTSSHGGSPHSLPRVGGRISGVGSTATARATAARLSRPATGLSAVSFTIINLQPLFLEERSLHALLDRRFGMVSSATAATAGESSEPISITKGRWRGVKSAFVSEAGGEAGEDLVESRAVDVFSDTIRLFMEREAEKEAGIAGASPGASPGASSGASPGASPGAPSGASPGTSPPATGTGGADAARSPVQLALQLAEERRREVAEVQRAEWDELRAEAQQEFASRMQVGRSVVLDVLDNNCVLSAAVCSWATNTSVFELISCERQRSSHEHDSPSLQNRYRIVAYKLTKEHPHRLHFLEDANRRPQLFFSFSFLHRPTPAISSRLSAASPWFAT